MLDDIISMAFELLGMFMAAGILVLSIAIPVAIIQLFYGVF